MCDWLIVNRPVPVFDAVARVVFFADDRFVAPADEPREIDFVVAALRGFPFLAPVFFVVRFLVGGNTFPSFVRGSTATFVAETPSERSEREPRTPNEHDTTAGNEATAPNLCPCEAFATR